MAESVREPEEEPEVVEEAVAERVRAPEREELRLAEGEPVAELQGEGEALVDTLPEPLPEKEEDWEDRSDLVEEVLAVMVREPLPVLVPEVEALMV